MSAPVRPLQALKSPSTDEKERLEGLSLADLRAEIVRLRPPSVDLAVESSQAVRQVRQQTRDLVALQDAAKAEEKRADQAQQRWRDEHPIKAKMHDAGILRSAELEQLGQWETQARQKLESLNPQVLQAKYREDMLREVERSNVRARQAPVLAKVAELERFEQQKEAQVRAQQAKGRWLDEAIAAFKTSAAKREKKSFGFDDKGERWKALPEPMRKVINDFNGLPKEAREASLNGMREKLKSDPQAVKKLMQLLGPAQEKQQDRGMER